MEGRVVYFEPGLRPRLCFSKMHLGSCVRGEKINRKKDRLDAGSLAALTLFLAVLCTDTLHLRGRSGQGVGAGGGVWADLGSTADGAGPCATNDRGLCGPDAERGGGIVLVVDGILGVGFSVHVH